MQKSNEHPLHHQFGLLLFNGFSNLCLANAVEPLRAANELARKELYSWYFLGLSDEAILSSSGLPVQPERLTQESRGEYLFVMPSYGHGQLATQTTRQHLRAAATRFKTLGGLDTGSWLLASAGLLDGYRATSHWDVLSALAENFPEVDVVDHRFVIDGPRISCGGATTTLELMLELIERHHGATLALEVSAMFMFGERDPKMNPLRLIEPHQTVRAAAALMRRNIEEPLSIAKIASGIGTNQRTLEQVFARETGKSPYKVYRSIRLAEVRRRLEQTTESITEIANRCGYNDPTAMTRAFKAEFGLTPSEIRRAMLFANSSL